jgi:hypothetical protein
MNIRDRITELRRVRVSDLRPNDRNWRTHPPAQRDALRGLLAEVGWADALLVREADDGVLEIIDGHLRAETAPDGLVPVLVLDVTAAEADKIMLTHDPLTAMAGTDTAQLAQLVDEFHTDNDALAAMLDALVVASQTVVAPTIEDLPEVAVPECYQVIVECENELQQEEVFQRLRSEGLKCRLLCL